MRIELTFLGRVPAKKNHLMPVTRKDGRRTLINDPNTDDLDRLALQIPGDARDARLVNPAIEWSFEIAKVTIDRDNVITTITDLLKSYGVLVEDNCKWNNGRWIVNPAELTGRWVTTVILDGDPQQQQPKRRKRAAAPLLGKDWLK